MNQFMITIPPYNKMKATDKVDVIDDRWIRPFLYDNDFKGLNFYFVGNMNIRKCDLDKEIPRIKEMEYQKYYRKMFSEKVLEGATNILDHYARLMNEWGRVNQNPSYFKEAPLIDPNNDYSNPFVKTKKK